MRILGLIGGTSWVSTIDYYRYINLGINERLGGLNFAKCIIYSLNFAEINKNNEAEDWDANLELFSDAAYKLIAGGAEAIVLCANTAHIIAERLAKRIDVPIIHIADATAKEINKMGFTKAALLGTRFTMEKDFFKVKLAGHGIEAIIPDTDDRAFIHAAIAGELARDIIKDETKQRFISIIDKLTLMGAEGVILGARKFRY